MTTKIIDSSGRFEEFERYDEATSDYGVVECGEPGCTNRAGYALMVYPPEGGSEGHAALLCKECLVRFSTPRLGQCL